MNCINHPTAEVAAYCQQCGKPLCNECVRTVGGMVYCEPCLASRLGIPAAGQVPPAPLPPSRPNPMLAGLLGLIPGVGAMYNGQLVKALAHVLIFIVFVSLSHHSSIFGIMVAAWVIYQAFDAYHTAEARLAGLPLPNPFGLNDLGTRLGIPQTPPYAAPPYASGFVSDPARPTVASQSPGDPAPLPPYWSASTAPTGAIVLIVVGLLLLFRTLGIFPGEWLDRSWPLVIVGLGVWLLYRQTHETPGGGSQ